MLQNAFAPCDMPPPHTTRARFMTAILTLTANPAIDVATTSDAVVHTRKIRCKDIRRDPGGGGINVARVVERLGGSACALYPVGGPLGELLKRLLDEEAIDSLTVDIGGDTRESFTVWDESSQAEYRFVLPGPELREREWKALLEAITGLESAPRYLVASGSLPPGVPHDFYARVAEAAKAINALFVLDTSGPPLAAALEAGVHLVKPNLRELRELTGENLKSEATWRAAAQRLVDQGKADAVALSLGHHGALLATGSGAWRAPVLPVKVASAVGAGDSFLGGMVQALAGGSEMGEAFCHGVAAGSAALLTPGTALCAADDVRRLLDDVRLDTL
jgi:6-phosphofructokinase 2